MEQSLRDLHKKARAENLPCALFIDENSKGETSATVLGLVPLMADEAPLLGVIVAPALGTIWRGAVGVGAARLAFADDGTISPPDRIYARKRPQREPIVLVSRSHLDPRTRAYVGNLSQPRTTAFGSALKFCRIAEGAADIYPRLAPTHDWDVAAGHAIVVAAGGQMLAPDGTRLRYGTPDLTIPAFIACGEAPELAPMDRGHS